MLLAQHGFGKGDLIREGLKAGLLDGVILSPRDESPEKLRDHAASLRDEFGTRPFITCDPQFYGLTIPNPRIGTLPDFYEGIVPGMSRADLSAPSKIQPSVQKILQFQHDLGVDRLIAPSVLMPSFRDPWSQIALSLAEIAMEVRSSIKGSAPLLVSLVIDENALLSRDALDEYLDIVTSWDDVAGFYLLVRPNDSNVPAQMQDGTIAHLLYLVHVLATINGFEVVAGYGDLFGTLLHAAGATHTGSGWFNSLRQFSLARFQPAGRGRQPRPRYCSGPLVTPILVIPELEAIQRVGKVATVLTGTPYDSAFAKTPAGQVAWAKPLPQLHHWATLRKLADHVRRPSDPVARIDAAVAQLATARITFDELRSAGVGFEAQTGGRHLEPWLRGVQGARALIAS